MTRGQAYSSFLALVREYEKERNVDQQEFNLHMTALLRYPSSHGPAMGIEDLVREAYAHLRYSYRHGISVFTECIGHSKGTLSWETIKHLSMYTDAPGIWAIALRMQHEAERDY